jgi:hypothetical protein
VKKKLPTVTQSAGRSPATKGAVAFLEGAERAMEERAPRRGSNLEGGVARPAACSEGTVRGAPESEDSGLDETEDGGADRTATGGDETEEDMVG